MTPNLVFMVEPSFGGWIPAWIHNYYILLFAGKLCLQKFFALQTPCEPVQASNRPRIARNFSRVAAGQSDRSVITAESRERCSGQLGSMGMRGMTAASTCFAVSALARR